MSYTAISELTNYIFLVVILLWAIDTFMINYTKKKPTQLNQYEKTKQEFYDQIKDLFQESNSEPANRQTTRPVTSQSDTQPRPVPERTTGPVTSQSDTQPRPVPKLTTGLNTESDNELDLELLKSLSIRELKKIASRYRVKGYSKMTKSEIVPAIEIAYTQQD